MKSRLAGVMLTAAAGAAAMTTLSGAVASGYTAPTARNGPQLIAVDRLTVSPRAERTLVDLRRRRRPPGTPPPSGAMCTTPGPGTSQFTTEGWKVAGPRTMHFNPSGTPAGLSNVAGSLQAALSAWDSADPRAPTLTVAADGTATAPTADHQDESMFEPLGSTTLAETVTWRWPTGEIESDIAINSNLPWFQAPSEGTGCYAVAAFDVQNALTHESGHVFGLGHADNSPYNTMYPGATEGETYKRSLARGDILGLQSIY